MGAVAKCAEFCEGVDLPIVTLEVRRRQRGGKPFVVMFVYVLVLAAVTIGGIYIFGTETSVRNAAGSPDLSSVGQGIFAAISFVQLAMISLVIPALTSRTITSEREAGTLEMLALTLMSSQSIVYQKLAVAVLQMGMLVLASLPVIAVTFMLGGVSPLEVLLSYVVLLVTALFYGSIGVLCSAVCSNSRSATFAAYLIILVVLPMCMNPVPFMAMMVLVRWLGPGGGHWSTLMGAISVVAVIGFSVLFNYVSARKLNSMRRSY